MFYQFCFADMEQQGELEILDNIVNFLSPMSQIFARKEMQKKTTSFSLDYSEEAPCSILTDGVNNAIGEALKRPDQQLSFLGLMATAAVSEEFRNLGLLTLFSQMSECSPIKI